jgi:hypothetical protein
MKLPAHLPECFFALELLASLIEILELDTIIILIRGLPKLSELILN